MKAQRIEPGLGQESVWDYPRPPRLEPVADRLRVVFGGLTIADTVNALRILETSHPPTYYIPPDDVISGVLVPSGRKSVCEWKGQAGYFDVVVDRNKAATAAWSYEHPAAVYAGLAGHFAFYAQFMDACFVGDERVQAQAGDFYGGWMTSRIVGPVKGPDGTWYW